jgi:predicted nucleotidyltransferase
MTLDFETIGQVLAAEPQVVFAFVFGSSQDGVVKDGSDVDLAVFLDPRPEPLEFYQFYQHLASRLAFIPDLDLVDLANADSVLAFEALCGKRLFVRSPERLAEFSSYTARQHEDDLQHASVQAA